MPLGSRNQQRIQAKIGRTSGQTIYLLIPPAQSTSTNTPYSISSADEPVDLADCKKVPVYAGFFWKTGSFTYGEGGQVLCKVAQVEIPFDWQTIVTQAYAVQNAAGEILLKKTQDLNESQTMYILTVESHVNTQQ